MGVVGDLSDDSPHRLNRFGPDVGHLAQVVIGEAVKSVKHKLPARVPPPHQIFACIGRSNYKLGVAVAIRLLTIGVKEIRPARSHVAGDMFDQDRYTVGLRIDLMKELILGQLLHGTLALGSGLGEEVVELREDIGAGHWESSFD